MIKTKYQFLKTLYTLFSNLIFIFHRFAKCSLFFLHRIRHLRLELMKFKYCKQKLLLCLFVILYIYNKFRIEVVVVCQSFVPQILIKMVYQIHFNKRFHSCIYSLGFADQVQENLYKLYSNIKENIACV